jgi:hypothetical protein
LFFEFNNKTPTILQIRHPQYTPILWDSFYCKWFNLLLIYFWTQKDHINFLFSSTIQSLPTFLGLNHENPYDFLNEFQTICSTIQLTGFTKDALKMCLFIFALKDRAKHWFQSLEPNSISSWDQLQQVFLKQYFPIGRTNDTRRAITSIT